MDYNRCMGSEPWNYEWLMSPQSKPEITAKWARGHHKVSQRSPQSEPEVTTKWVRGHHNSEPRSHHKVSQWLPQSEPEVTTKWARGHHKWAGGQPQGLGSGSVIFCLDLDPVFKFHWIRIRFSPRIPKPKKSAEKLRTVKNRNSY